MIFKIKHDLKMYMLHKILSHRCAIISVIPHIGRLDCFKVFAAIQNEYFSGKIPRGRTASTEGITFLRLLIQIEKLIS